MQKKKIRERSNMYIKKIILEEKKKKKMINEEKEEKTRIKYVKMYI